MFLIRQRKSVGWDCWHKGLLVQGGIQLWKGATSERSDAGSGVKQKKGESCQMASVSYPSRMIHIYLGKPRVPQSCGYTDTWVVEEVGFHCSHGRDVSSVAKLSGGLQFSLLSPYSLQTKIMSHFLEK